MDVSLDVTRTVALMVFGALAIAGAILLWALERDTGAAAVFTLGEAIVVGGFGLAIGEKGGAEAARQVINEASDEPR